MESSSKAFDFSPHILTVDEEKKLLQIFCFLRQHERKAKVVKKVAELQRASHVDTLVPKQHPTVESIIEDLDQSNLLDELNFPSDLEAGSTKQLQKQHASSTTSLATIAELRREIKELQKGIITASYDSSGFITAADIGSAMRAMHKNATKGEIQWMIWEADDDADGCIDWYEFKGCYTRSMMDKHSVEPNQLYHFIQFLLCDTDGNHAVSVLELSAELRRLSGTDHLVTKLMSALKDEAEQQLLQKFTLTEYLDVMISDLPSKFW